MNRKMGFSAARYTNAIVFMVVQRALFYAVLLHKSLLYMFNVVVSHVNPVKLSMR